MNSLKANIGNSPVSGTYHAKTVNNLRQLRLTLHGRSVSSVSSGKKTKTPHIKKQATKTAVETVNGGKLLSNSKQKRITQEDFDNLTY